MFRGVDVEYRSAPALADLDGDGDTDMIVGRNEQGGGGGTLLFFENTGTLDYAKWVDRGIIRDEDDFEISAQYYSAPALSDMDDDGDFDLTIAGYYGDFQFYRNIGTTSNPIWSNDDAVYDGVDGEVYSAPSLADLDGDGDDDLVIGDRDGKLKHYENTGDPTVPEWIDRGNIRDSENHEIEVGVSSQEQSAPVFGDLDNDGDFDLLIGTGAGELLHYNNQGSPTDPSWVGIGYLKDENGGRIDIGRQSMPALGDLGETPEEEPEGDEYIWHTKITTSGNHTFDFLA